MRYRNRVLGMLSLLSVITYLDRVCISVAGPRMQQSLHLGPAQWGWVTGIFTLAYGLFEIPSGTLGDRIGPRRVLTRIVLWWSAFTSLTGLAAGYKSLLAIRFLFGAGEAGAFPNISIAVARWFPARERGRAFGIILMSAQIGAALSPLLVIPIQSHYGWRGSFYAFGLLGVVWSVIWFRWFRDSPQQMPGVPQIELDDSPAPVAHEHRRLPWGLAFRSANFWYAMGIGVCYIYTFNFFQTWFHTYLVKAHGFSEKDLLFTTLPYILAACANLAGGVVSNLLVERVGLKWGRRSIGVAGQGLAAIGAVAVLFAHSHFAVLTLLSLMYACIAFQQPLLFALSLDIGGDFAGATVGVINMACQASGLVTAVAYGYIVAHTGNYNLPFIPMAALLLLGVFFWLRVDPTQPITPAGSFHSPKAHAIET
jgi:ACS family glucarate transporter-like MFS transporter